MKIKIFFLISAMNALSYSGFGNCCGDCCGECFWKKDENIKEKFSLEEKKNTGEEFKKFVNEDWLKDKKGIDLKFKFYEKKKDGNIKVIEYKNGEIIVENFNQEPDTGKWALFEIKTTENNTVYLYCSDIESKYNDGIFRLKDNISSISVLACNTSNVTNMGYMFGNCYNLGDLDLSKFDTKTVTNMGNMFDNCRSLKKLDLSNFNTSKVTDMSYMFDSCFSLENLDLSKFDTSSVTDMAYMFDECKNLNKVTVSKNVDTKNEILPQLNKDVVKWEEAKNNIEGNICILIKQN